MAWNSLTKRTARKISNPLTSLAMFSDDVFDAGTAEQCEKWEG